MPQRKYKPMAVPHKEELLEAIDRADRQLTRLYSKWGDGIPIALRIELHDIATPLLRLLMRSGRR